MKKQISPKMNNKSRELYSKVLHVAPTPFFSDRGCHIRIRGIVEALNRRGLRNVVCTYYHGRTIDGVETIRTWRVPGYKKVEAGPSAFKYIADIYLLFTTVSCALSLRPQVVHGHLHEGVLIGWIAKKLLFWREMSLVFDVQGSLVGELLAHGYFRNAPWLRKVYWVLEWMITKLPDHFLCSSKASADILIRVFGVNPNKVEVVSDGVDARTGIVQDVTRRSEKPTAVYSGGLVESKGIEVLKEIILQAKSMDIGWRFLVVGYPVEEFRNWIEENGLERSCQLIGRVAFEELPNYLASAWVALEPKQDGPGEASGKLLNYMAAGLPVICFRRDNNVRLLGNLGYYANSGEDFVAYLQEIMRSPDDARLRGERSRQRVLENWSWDCAAEKICYAYEGRAV